MGEKQASTTDATAKPPLAALAPRATHKPLAEVLMGLVEGLCPACAGPDLHSAALNDEAAVSCGDCGWFATYRALRERVAALRESALERALAESLRLQSHYAVLLNHHDGGARRIFPSIESWLDRLAELATPEHLFSAEDERLAAGAPVLSRLGRQHQAALEAAAHRLKADPRSPAEERSQNLVQALQAEIARVRDSVLPAYVSVGAPGSWAVGCMREDIRQAERAIGQGDAVAMLARLASLREYHT